MKISVRIAAAVFLASAVVLTGAASSRESHATSVVSGGGDLWCC